MRTVFIALALSVAACSLYFDDHPTPLGRGPDARSGPWPDAHRGDGGTPDGGCCTPDAGTGGGCDGGIPDGGGHPDAGTGPDGGGHPDAGTGPDGGGLPDAGPRDGGICCGM